MSANVGLDELAGDAHAIARLANAAFEDVAHAELASYPLDLDRLAFVGEARVAGDDEERLGE